MQCPDCKSNSVQSKGWRTKGVHRYLCNNCGRNFTVDTRTKKETGIILTMTEGDKIKPPEKIREEVNANIVYDESIVPDEMRKEIQSMDIEKEIKKMENKTIEVGSMKIEEANTPEEIYDSLHLKREMTNIAVSKEIRAWIESLKIVKQEPFNSVLERLQTKIKNDKEFWIK